jgi:hypothetical protein
MTAPLASIVINNYNYARYLPQSIESALAQTYPWTEVIVVDDSSQDCSREVIARYARRVVPVLQEHNRGQGAAINAGFRACRGDIVILLDADDYLYPHAAERVAEAWVEGLANLHYRLDLVDAAGQWIDIYPPPEVRFEMGDVVPRLLQTGRYEATVTSGNAFARSVLAKILPIPEEEFRISADGYLVTVAPFHGPVGAIDEPLGAYRLHGGNAWAMSTVQGTSDALAARFRRELEHDRCRHEALAAVASEHGLALRPNPGLRDHQHLGARLGSLRLDAARHPYAKDSRFALAARGAWAVLRARAWVPWRLILAAWFLIAGLLPSSLARRVISWRFAQGTRPAMVDRLLKTVRRAIPRRQYSRDTVAQLRTG